MHPREQTAVRGCERAQARNTESLADLAAGIEYAGRSAGTFTGRACNYHGSHSGHRIGIASQPHKKQGVLFVSWHIDWSERKHHMAGAFGAAFARRLFDLKWIERHSTNRALSLTPQGRIALEQAFDLRFDRHIA
jgi:hypothetical protein